MSLELRLPNLTGKTEKEQLEQIKGYLFSTIRQLNWALQTIEQNEEQTKVVVERMEAKASSPDAAQDLFNTQKNLIIKDADIVQAYGDKISKDLESVYVAQSTFGTYQKEVTAALEATADTLTQNIKAVETIGENQRITEGYVKTGIIGYDSKGAVIGVEIKSGTDGEPKVFARYTAKGTELFNEYGNPTIVLQENKTKLTGNVTLTGANASLSMNGFVLDPTDGIGLYWEGE